MAMYSFFLGWLIALTTWTFGFGWGGDFPFSEIANNIDSYFFLVFRSLILAPVLESLGLVGLILLCEWF
ncbi:MAG: hypothetical protein O7B35_19765, partial [Deltaproteobacteria bacterium]|nr:hypothetical protein [Deltaproteobacteria bacterium]